MSGPDLDVLARLESRNRCLRPVGFPVADGTIEIHHFADWAIDWCCWSRHRLELRAVVPRDPTWLTARRDTGHLRVNGTRSRPDGGCRAPATSGFSGPLSCGSCAAEPTGGFALRFLESPQPDYSSRACLGAKSVPGHTAASAGSRRRRAARWSSTVGCV